MGGVDGGVAQQAQAGVEGGVELAGDLEVDGLYPGAEVARVDLPGDGQPVDTGAVLVEVREQLRP